MNAGQLINTYYMFIEIYCNLYNFFYKSYLDNWSVSFSDTISNYDQNWGLQYIVTEGDTWQYWTSEQVLWHDQVSYSSPKDIYFTLLKPCLIRARVGTNTNLNNIFISIIATTATIIERFSTVQYTKYGWLNPGRYMLSVYYSSVVDNCHTYIYMAGVNNYNYQGTFTPGHFIFNVLI